MSDSSRTQPARGDGRRSWRLVRAGTDGVPASVGGPGRRPGASRRQRVLRLLSVAAAVLVLGTATWLVYGTGLLAVSSVRVTGTQVLSADQVREAAGVAGGTPLARVDTDRVAARVSRLAPVAGVVVERDWPDGLVIRVTERTPAAVVPSEGRLLVVDGEGVVFDTVSKRPRQLPLVELADPGPDDPLTRDALRVVAALTPQLRSVLVKLRAPSRTRITLRLTKRRTVIWGDAEHSRKKARAATALLEHRVRVIDVSAPDVVTTR